MTISRARIIAAVFTVTICGISASRSVGQETPSWKTQPLVIIKYDGDMAALLATLANKYGVTIGLEIDPTQPRPQVGFYLEEASLTNILDAICKSAPRYQWRESGGFIEVLPSHGSSQLLDTVISSFRVADIEEKDAINQLIELPEVQARMMAIGLKLRDLPTASTESKDKKFSLSLKDVTMRGVLNSVAKESGAKFWLLRRDSDGSFSINNWTR